MEQKNLIVWLYLLSKTNEGLRSFCSNLLSNEPFWWPDLQSWSTLKTMRAKCFQNGNWDKKVKHGENKGRADSQDLCENSSFHVSHNLIKVLLSLVFAWHSVPEDKMFCVIWTQVLNNHHNSNTNSNWIS